MNLALAEILFSNLIQNSMRHNINAGRVIIKISENSFSIYNTGNSSIGTEATLFDRFVIFNSSDVSLGLGLAIVKQIGDFYNFKVSYTHESDLHCFKVIF